MVLFKQPVHGQLPANRLTGIGPSLKRPSDTEVLVLGHMEQMTTAEIAATLAISEAVVKKRHVRALERLRVLCSTENPNDTEEYR